MVHYRIGSLFWVALGAAVGWAAYRMGLGSLSQPGPGFIFFAMAAIVVVLGAVDIGATFMRGAGARGQPAGQPWGGVRWRRITLVAGALVLFVVVLRPLGYLLSTFLLMTFLFRAVEPVKWWISIAAGAGAALGSYAVFGLWLNVRFPQGVLGF